MIQSGVQRNRAMRDDWVTRAPDLVVIVRDATMGNRQEES